VRETPIGHIDAELAAVISRHARRRRLVVDPTPYEFYTTGVCITLFRCSAVPLFRCSAVPLFRRPSSLSITLKRICWPHKTITSSECRSCPGRFIVCAVAA